MKVQLAQRFCQHYVLSHLIVAVISFHFGYLYGGSFSSSTGYSTSFNDILTIQPPPISSKSSSNGRSSGPLNKHIQIDNSNTTISTSADNKAITAGKIATATTTNNLSIVEVMIQDDERNVLLQQKNRANKDEEIEKIINERDDLLKKYRNIVNKIQKDDASLLKDRKEEQSSQQALLRNSNMMMSRRAARVNHDEFIRTFDLGVPLLPKKKKQKDSGINNNDVLILYTSDKSLPNETKSSANNYYTALDATENCNTMKVVLNDGSYADGQKSCLAITNQWESYSIHKWVRRKPSQQKNKKKNTPLQLENVGQHIFYDDEEGDEWSHLWKKPPDNTIVKESFNILDHYLQHYEKALETLKPIAKKVASSSEGGNNSNKGVIIVMTTNYAQSHLLINYVCTAKRRNINILKNIIVFATDIETFKLGNKLGLTVFYDEDIFYSIPKNDPKYFGDSTFASIIMSKVYSVHMINALGYDVLFQDVDIVPYKNGIIEYFNNNNKKKTTTEKENNNSFLFDMYFQYDWNNNPDQSPYSANSGLYYVRFNERTQYLFSMLVRMGDIIKTCQSHQQTLIMLMRQQSSLFGLRVKILYDDSDLFPNGRYYHQDKKYMKKLITEGNNNTTTTTTKPYIFHMNWNTNKKEKIQFLSQMGNWYVNETCITTKTTTTTKEQQQVGNNNECPYCTVEPLINCYYKDKPSVIPCKKSKSHTKGASSWW